MLITRHAVDFAYTRPELEALFRYAHAHDVEHGGRYDARSAAVGRLRTLCSDGTRAVSTYNKTLSRWETTITASPRRDCSGRLNPRTQQVEVRCR